MAKSKSSGTSSKGGSKGAAKGAAPVEPLPPSMGAFAAGAAALVIAVIASAVLTLDSLGAITAPGCGVESDCATAAQSFWGTIPGLGWPTSFAGFTYFLSVLVAWLLTRGCFFGFMRWIVRLGALFSAFLIVEMFRGGYLCHWCLIAHLGNFGFLGVMEFAGRVVPLRGRPLLAFVSMILVVTGGIALVQGWVQAEQREKGERAHQEDIDRIVGQNGDGGGAGQVRIDEPRDDDENGATANAGDGGEAADGDSGDGAVANRDTDPDSDPANVRDDFPERGEGALLIDPDPNDPSTWFTGRYRVGPEKAAIRIVAFSSYQCPDCKRIEDQFEQLLEERDDVSFSMMHFPMSSLCNEYMNGANPQPNSCWAARAAETAGILRGTEGFWEMHQWLFSVSGAFTQEALLRQLRSMGYDPNEFIRIMTSAETEQRVKGDIELARALGLHYTPMIFVNGVELKGWFARDAVLRTVEAVSARNPEPKTAAADIPPFAAEKYITDWEAQPYRTIFPDDAAPHIMGLPAEDAAVEVVVWGDYQEPYTAELDVRLRAILENADDVSYHFRHYPINQECNSATPITKHENACLAHRAAEAAGRLGGSNAYWTMHIWLMEHQDELSTASLRTQAEAMGLDPAALFAEMDSAEVAQAIEEDAAAAKRIGLRSIPYMFINRKYVPRWRLEGERIPEELVERARETAEEG